MRFGRWWVGISNSVTGRSRSSISKREPKLGGYYPSLVRTLSHGLIDRSDICKPAKERPGQLKRWLRGGLPAAISIFFHFVRDGRCSALQTWCACSRACGLPRVQRAGDKQGRRRRRRRRGLLPHDVGGVAHVRRVRRHHAPRRRPRGVEAQGSDRKTRVSKLKSHCSFLKATYILFHSLQSFDN